MLLQSVLVAVDMKEAHGKPQASHCSKETHLTLPIAHGLVPAGNQGGTAVIDSTKTVLITYPITLKSRTVPIFPAVFPLGVGLRVANLTPQPLSNCTQMYVYSSMELDYPIYWLMISF